MVQMIRPQRSAFKQFANWVDNDLPQVPQKPQVWKAFRDHSRFGSDESAKAALGGGLDPWVFVEKISGFKGLFDPSRPETISISMKLVEQYDASPEDAQVRAVVEATVLHEMVHWSWAAAGQHEPPGSEKGEDFERQAYGNLADVERPALPATTSSPLGELSRRYESNGKPGAIGKDKNGGWSYGLYQLSSRQGRVADFLTFLRNESSVEPAYGEFEAALQAAGGDVGARQGTALFREAWQNLAANRVFNDAQHRYIKASHYDPFIVNLRVQGIELSGRSDVLHDVAWSVSVQHGPGKVVIFTRPWRSLGSLAREDDALFIDAIYRERKRVDVYFTSSTEEERKAVLKRFQNEGADALRRLAAQTV